MSRSRGDRTVLPSRRRARRASTFGLLLLGAGLGAAFLASTPVYSSGDEAAHVDYALQVWTGHLPVFENGLVLENTTGRRPPVQWTAQHPPLFYALLAPAVGPLALAGHVEAAAMAGRVVVALMGVALLFAARWFAELAVPRLAGVGTLAAVLVALSAWWGRLSGAVYNDVLAALAGTLAAALTLRLLRDPRPRTFLLFTAALCAAALTRISVVPLCLLLLTVVLLHRLVVDRATLLVAARRPVVAGLAVLLTSGWFYVRNIVLTGSVTGGHPDWAEANTPRSPRPFLDVATDLEFWNRMLQQAALWTRSPVWDQWVPEMNALLLVLPVLAGLVLVAVALVRRRPLMDAWALAVVIGACSITAVLQVWHVATAGSALPRYFFALVPFLAPLVAVALLRWRYGFVLALAWVALRLPFLGRELVANTARDWTGQAPVHPAVVVAGAVVATVGLVLALAAVAVEVRDRALSARRT